MAAIELLSYFFDDLWARHLLSEISRICDSQGAGVALVSAISDERLHWNIQSAVVDGFILLCVEGGERLVEITRARKLPYVALSIGSADTNIPAIGVDNVHGARLAAQHLLSLGHRRFGILSTQIDDDRVGLVAEADMRNARYSTSRDRAIGYWQAIEAAGLAIFDIPIMITQEDEQSTHANMVQLFGGRDRPTALLAMSDKIAMWAVDWLLRNGITVPTDVSVVGFDGVPESAVATPKLTTVEQPMAECDCPARGGSGAWGKADRRPPHASADPDRPRNYCIAALVPTCRSCLAQFRPVAAGPAPDMESREIISILRPGLANTAAQNPSTDSCRKFRA